MSRDISAFSVPSRRVTHYLLAASSPEGASKAKFFLKNGFVLSAPEELSAALCAHGASAPKQVSETSPYGERLICDGPMKMPNGSERLVRTVWQHDGSSYILLTAFPGRKSYLRDDQYFTMRDLIDIARGSNGEMIVENAGTAAERFEDAFDAQFDASPLVGKVRVQLHHHGDAEVEISHIQTASGSRGEGLGSRTLAMLTQAADETGVTLYASPASDADGEDGLVPGDLRDWYERWGFRGQPGVDAMRRRPRKR